MTKKLFVLVSLLLIAMPTFADYEEIECSNDSVFLENSCNQCFEWGEKIEWNHLGLLSDLWMNVTDVAKLLYKEEQELPEMINLDPSNVSWIQTPDSDNFWEYTDEFDTLYSDVEEGYVLNSGDSVTWIKTTLSHAYKLDSNTSAKGSNIGLLVFPIYTHNILADWEITIDNSEHRECVLFKSWEASEEVIDEPKTLPETGPWEIMLLAILAMLLGFGVLQFRTKS